MDIQILGTISKICEPQSGVSQSGREWCKQDYVLEVDEGRYSNLVCFQIFGRDKIDEADLKAGERVVVHLSISAREYNGKYYNTITCFKVDKEEEAQAPQQQDKEPDPIPTNKVVEQQTANPINQNTAGDELPF